MFILDFGSGETCKNDLDYVYKMIDAIPPSKKDVVIKWQLFENIQPLVPLEHEVYIAARNYAASKGYRTGASVFDEPSLDFLLSTSPDYVKIACRPHLYYLIDNIPVDVQTIVSVPDYKTFGELTEKYPDIDLLCCVADYPAEPYEYIQRFGETLHYGISDHTTDWGLYGRYQPLIYECHYCLPDSTGPDAAEFARRPSDLEEVF
jgi:sialic acid synthase SpsE